MRRFQIIAETIGAAFVILAPVAGAQTAPTRLGDFYAQGARRKHALRAPRGRPIRNCNSAS
jgi:hypothetical protein